MKKKEFEFIDLGLPSGRLWASENAEGYFTYDDAKEKFGELLPPPEAFQELYDECQWLWDVKKKGMLVIGPNKNSIFLPASGYRSYDSGGLALMGSLGLYWSYASASQARARGLYFDSGGVYPLNNSYRSHGFSVRPSRELR